MVAATIASSHDILDYLRSTTEITTEMQAREWLELFNIYVREQEKKLNREQILNRISPLRSRVKGSWLLNHAQSWPRGYAGDFEMIGYLLDGINKTPTNAFGYHLESIFLNSPIAQQHRNKVLHQMALIRQVLSANKNARILSVGCGTSEDLSLCRSQLETSKASLTLIDIDPNALSLSAERLQSLGDRITLMPGNIYKLSHKLTATYDLILIGGVFDYCSDRYVTSILQALTKKLNDGGRLFFTNIASGNPYRTVMEYLTDWQLIERDSYSVVSLLNQSCIETWKQEMHLDATRLTWLVTITKPGHHC